jgi:Flp pilus assembly protein TadD
LDSGQDAHRLFEAGVDCWKRGDVDQALKHYRRAVEIAPDHADAWNNMGVILYERKQFAAAVACHRRAVLATPSKVHYRNLGNILRQTLHFEEAAEIYGRLLALDPNDPETLHHHGTLLHSLGDDEGAVNAFSRAIERLPQNHDIRWDRSLVLLASGEFKRGFAEYEARWHVTKVAPRQLPVPLWQGESIARRSILVHAEQGLGDTLQFVRYVPMLVKKKARVVLAVQPELTRLLKGIAGLAAVLPYDGKLPVTDFYVPLMSLPLRFGTTLETIPANIPYLSAPADLSAKLKRPPGTKLAIGIVWAGGATHPGDRHRSIAVDKFLALADLPGVSLYSLQKGPGAGDLAASGGSALIHDDIASALRDFAATAAALTQLDLIISADTAIVHLAGAMGRPCWVLLPYVADWRWLRKRDDSPWYPTLRLFRQETPGDWHDVMRRVRAAVQGLTGS